jgi:hypothetical protein
MDFAHNAKHMNMRKITIQAIMNALFFVQTLTWKDALAKLLDKMIPIVDENPIATFVEAGLTSVICVLMASFIARCVKH